MGFLTTVILILFYPTYYLIMLPYKYVQNAVRGAYEGAFSRVRGYHRSEHPGDFHYVFIELLRRQWRYLVHDEEFEKVAESDVPGTTTYRRKKSREAITNRVSRDG